MKDYKNLNHLAIEIALMEGLNRQMSIAQIKEVIRCLCVVMFNADSDEVTKLIRAMVEAGKKSRRR